MIKPEKASYSRLALNEGLKQLKSVHLTTTRKNCHYPLFYELNKINEWLEDNAGNRFAFHCYYLEEYKDRLYNHYSDTTKKELSRLARLSKSDMINNIESIFQCGANGSVDIL